MKKCILFFAAIWMTLCFCSCDDGRIYEKEVNIQRGGRAMKLTGRFSGISNWTDDYSVVVAGFNDKRQHIGMVHTRITSPVQDQMYKTLFCTAGLHQ